MISPHRFASPLYATPRAASRRTVMLRSLALRNSMQRNDSLISTPRSSARRPAALCIASPLTAALRISARLFVLPRSSTQRNDCLSRRAATQRHRASALRSALFRRAAQRLTAHRCAAHRVSARCDAMPLNSTQRLVWSVATLRHATHCSALLCIVSRLNVTLLGVALRISMQRNDLFGSPQRSVPPRSAARQGG